MSGNNLKICIMQTRCRYEIFLVCFFVVKTTRVRLWHYKFSRYAPRIFFAKRLVCELPPVSLRISVIEFVKIAIGKQRWEISPLRRTLFRFHYYAVFHYSAFEIFLDEVYQPLILISSRSIFISNSWLSVSKYLDRSKHTAYLYPSSAYSFTFGMASFALLCGL